jgi:tripartite-type tricarboxylate transporter receptor subunit TctC
MGLEQTMPAQCRRLGTGRYVHCHPILAAPTGTPAAVVERIHRDLVAITKSAAFAAKLESQGLVGEVDSLSALAASMKKERESYAAFIKRNGIVASD